MAHFETGAQSRSWKLLLWKADVEWRHGAGFRWMPEGGRRRHAAGGAASSEPRGLRLHQLLLVKPPSEPNRVKSNTLCPQNRRSHTRHRFFLLASRGLTCNKHLFLIIFKITQMSRNILWTSLMFRSNVRPLFCVNLNITRGGKKLKLLLRCVNVSCPGQVAAAP